VQFLAHFGALVKNSVSPVQSACRTHHSTETALVKIYSDLAGSVDKGQVGAIALFDLSLAIDTVDHPIGLLSDVLPKRFGVTGAALAWLESYTNRSCQWSLVSRPAQPLSVAEYCRARCWALKRFEDIDEIFDRHGLEHHCYDDDTQMYVSAPPSKVQSIAMRLQRCIADIADWCSYDDSN